MKTGWLALLAILLLCLGGCDTIQRADDSLNHTIDRLQDKSYNGMGPTPGETPLVQGG